MKLKSVTIIFLLFLIPQTLFCEIVGTKEYPSQTNIPLTSYRIRPKDNSSIDNTIECLYSRGYLYISFTYSEGNATLKITRINDGLSENSTFSTWNPYTHYIGEQQGTYQIDIKTSHDIEYSGFLYIN